MCDITAFSENVCLNKYILSKVLKATCIKDFEHVRQFVTVCYQLDILTTQFALLVSHQLCVTTCHLLRLYLYAFA